MTCYRASAYCYKCIVVSSGDANKLADEFTTPTTRNVTSNEPSTSKPKPYVPLNDSCDEESLDDLWFQPEWVHGKNAKKMARKNSSKTCKTPSIVRNNQSSSLLKISQVNPEIITPHHESTITPTSSIVSTLTGLDSALDLTNSEDILPEPRSIFATVVSTTSVTRVVSINNVSQYLENNCDGIYQYFDWYEGTFPPLPDNYAAVPASRVGRCVVYQRYILEATEPETYILAWVYNEAEWMLEKLSEKGFKYCCTKGIIRISGGQQDSTSLPKETILDDNQVNCYQYSLSFSIFISIILFY